MKKKLLALALALTMALSLAACGGSNSSESTDGNSFKVGVIGPLTGDAAIYGTCVANSAQIAVDEINALGGDIQFELMTEDDVNDAETSVNAYNALMDDGMQLLVGTVTTQPALSVVPLAYEDRVFTITPSASGDDVIAINDNDNVFQICFTDSNQGSRSAQYIDENFENPQIAIIYKNDDQYSIGIRDNFKAEADARGMSIVYEGTFTTASQTDFNVQLAAAQSAGADLLFLPIYYTPASAILTQANTLGYKPTFFGVDGMDGILTAKNFDASLAEGVYLLTPFSADAEDEMTQNFVTKYQEAYGETPNQFGADAYDAIYTLYQAIQAAGVTADMSNEEICDALIEVMPTISVTGLTSAGSEMTWDENGAVSKDPTAVIIENGTYVTP
ncbi:MAG TPA: ABC transporter substrate-binding protein [Candidatus Oscillibacter avistercoris]|nr:ABC transporter substrate-binding protein [Candidatus Oscillibacter avistercoris]